jgi:hypothetical protein
MEVPYVPTSAETVTEDWLKKVVAKELGVLNNAPAERSSITITHMHVSPGAMRTEGFLSRLQRIHVKARKDPPRKADSAAGDKSSMVNGDVAGEEKEFRLVAKLFPPGEFHQKIVRNWREIFSYSTFLLFVLSFIFILFFLFTDF